MQEPGEHWLINIVNKHIWLSSICIRSKSMGDHTIPDKTYYLYWKPEKGSARERFSFLL